MGSWRRPRWRTRSSSSRARRRTPSSSAGPHQRSSAWVRGSSWAAQRRCGSTTYGLPGFTTEGSGGRPSSSSGWAANHWSSWSSPATRTAAEDPQPRRPARPDLLPERGDRAGEPVEDHSVEPADVDAELEGGGGHHRGQLAGEQLVLDGPPLLGEVAAPVGAHPGGQGAGQAAAHLRGDGLGGPAAAGERERGVPRVDQPRGDRRRLAVGRGPSPRAAVEQRRLPQRDRARRARGAVVEDRHHLDAGDRRGQPLRLAHGGRAADEGRLGAVVGGQAPQPAEELGDVAAEGAAERVELVDHHVAEAPEERAPPLVVRQQAGVEHLGVGEHDVGLLADPGALLRRGVAVVGAGHHLREVERGERPQLVVGQRLRGEQDQPRARPHRLGDGLADGQLVAAGLARPGAGGDDHGASGPGQVEGLDLVRPQRLRHRRGQPLRERAGQLGRAGGPAGQMGEVHEAAGLGVGRPSRGRGPARGRAAGRGPGRRPAAPAPRRPRGPRTGRRRARSGSAGSARPGGAGGPWGVASVRGARPR